jgi:ADP-ribosylglycohydrolase
MEMPGGGIFGVKKGQVTDDSELAFHLLNAMANFDFKSTFPAQRDNLIINIAYEYLCWGDSRPFDIGITCRNSLEAIRTVFN